MFDLDTAYEEWERTMAANGIDRIIVQPYPGAPNPLQVHEQIAALSKKHPGKVYGMISLNPHTDNDTFLREVDSLVKDKGFVGIKLHTIGHAINPAAKDAVKVFETAKKYDIPVMVHTGAGVPFSLPSAIIPRAQEYPEVKIILAHSGGLGGALFVPEYVAAAKACRNIYLETSWSSVLEKQTFVTEFGERVLYGSDLPNNAASEIHQFRELEKAGLKVERCLGESARKLFRLGSV